MDEMKQGLNEQKKGEESTRMICSVYTLVLSIATVIVNFMCQLG